MTRYLLIFPPALLVVTTLLAAALYYRRVAHVRDVEGERVRAAVSVVLNVAVVLDDVASKAKDTEEFLQRAASRSFSDYRPVNWRLIDGEHVLWAEEFDAVVYFVPDLAKWKERNSDEVAVFMLWRRADGDILFAWRFLSGKTSLPYSERHDGHLTFAASYLPSAAVHTSR